LPRTLLHRPACGLLLCLTPSRRSPARDKEQVRDARHAEQGRSGPAARKHGESCPGRPHTQAEFAPEREHEQQAVAAQDCPRYCAFPTPGKNQPHARCRRSEAGYGHDIGLGRTGLACTVLVRGSWKVLPNAWLREIERLASFITTPFGQVFRVDCRPSDRERQTAGRAATTGPRQNDERPPCGGRNRQ
jgi:hypothetical protein